MLLRPTVTIITAVLNGAAYLEQCISSVLAQKQVSAEHILLDGGSTDGTLDIIRRHAGSFSYWQSEPDHGIADAMNQGIAKAKGEWLLFLQSDDYLPSPLVLARATEHLASEVDIYAFPILYGREKTLVARFPHGANFWLNFKTGFFHQGAFIRRSLFEQIGFYDTQFKIAMDYEFFLRAYRAGARFACHREPPIAVMGDTGISSQRDWTNMKKRFAEEKRIHYKHKTVVLIPFYWLYWLLYPAYRWLCPGGIHR